MSWQKGSLYFNVKHDAIEAPINISFSNKYMMLCGVFYLISYELQMSFKFQATEEMT